MIISIHQPAYLPWLGYFDKIARADLFVFLDTVQFEAGSFINRNRIKTANGPAWLTIPVKAKDHLAKTLLELEVDARQPWRDKHLRSIRYAYAKAPRFTECMPRLAGLFSDSEQLLAEICYRQLLFWLDELGIKTPVVRASSLPDCGRKSDLVLNICRHLGATCYISGALGRGYLVEESFRAAGITVEFQDYRHPAYPQLHGDFLPYMSIVDFWMNCDTPNLIWSTS